MAKKNNQFKLLIVLISLILVFVLIKVFRSNRYESTIDTQLNETIDTTKVSAIYLYPSNENKEEIRLEKNKDSWTASKGNLSVEADAGVINSIINVLPTLKPLKLSGTSKEKWNEYQVTDSAGTRVKIFEKNKCILDVVIGKFNYQQQQNPYGQQGGYGGITGDTYVRVYDEENVYSVNGFLIFTFNQPFNSFRNQKIARFTKEKLQKMSFTYPADSGFIALKTDSINWFINGNKCDSTSINSYIDALSYKNHSEFKDGLSLPPIADYELKLEFKSETPITIKAFKISEDEYAIFSSFNPKNYFKSNKTGIVFDIFKSRSKF